MSLVQTDVLVAGGGLAGVAAAVVLAERGVAVTLVEQHAQLGGRLAGWDDQLSDGSQFQMERGFHAFFRQYYNLRSLLKRIDPELRLLRPLADYPILGPEGRRQSFTGLRTKAPLNVIDMVRQTDTLKLKDLLSINVRAALEMLAFDPKRSYAHFDHISARDYLDSLGFPSRARQMLFDVFSHSFFNPEIHMSAAEMLAMFHFYFMGNPEGLIFDVLSQPFSTGVWQPLEAYFAKYGVIIKKNCQIVTARPDGFGGIVAEVAQGSETRQISAKALVFALNVPGIKALIENSPELGDRTWRQSIQSLDVTYRFAVWRLWLDGDVDKDRAEFAGTTGVGLLDNISLFHRIEDESANWAAQHHGSVVELHAYAIAPDLDAPRIKASLLQGLHALYPETAALNIVQERFLLEQDCPAFAPGSHANRPTVATGMSQCYLAGDFVRLPFPSALMERAVTTGMMAANHILERRNLPIEPIQTTPAYGIAAWTTQRLRQVTRSQSVQAP